MAKIPRVPVKVFGSDGPVSQFAQYGSLMEGVPQKTKDLNLLQALDTYLQGMFPATSGADKPPAIEDENGLRYLFSSLIAYLYQDGIPEWDKDTEYYVDSLAKQNGIIYRALQDNKNKPVFVSGSLNSAFWKRDYALEDDFVSLLNDYTTQIALKASLDSPALTGEPTAPTAEAGTNSTQLATTEYVDSALLPIVLRANPVNSYYTQYAGANNTFDANEAPGVLFGGTWTLLWSTEGTYFQTEGGGSMARTNGFQDDAIRTFWGRAGLTNSIVFAKGATVCGCDGVFYDSTFISNARTFVETNYTYGGGITLDVSRQVPTDSVVHPRNRLIRVWKRTA